MGFIGAQDVMVNVDGMLYYTALCGLMKVDISTRLVHGAASVRAKKLLLSVYSYSITRHWNTEIHVR